MFQTSLRITRLPKRFTKTHVPSEHVGPKTNQCSRNPEVRPLPPSGGNEEGRLVVSSGSCVRIDASFQQKLHLRHEDTYVCGGHSFRFSDKTKKKQSKSLSTQSLPSPRGLARRKDAQNRDAPWVAPHSRGYGMLSQLPERWHTKTQQ